MNRLIAILTVFLGITALNMVNVHAEIVEGRDYEVLANPQPTQNSDLIEVIEFFWYGCPHCNTVQPHVKTWLINKPDDVDFRYVPAIFRDNWVPGAKIFYSIETLGVMDKLHDKIYDAIHREKVNLSDESVLFNWIEKQGVDKEKFVNVYNSFTTQNQIARSRQMMRQYQLTGVPTFVIDGKYLTTARKGGTHQNTMRIVDEIVDMVRSAKE